MKSLLSVPTLTTLFAVTLMSTPALAVGEGGAIPTTESIIGGGMKLTLDILLFFIFLSFVFGIVKCYGAVTLLSNQAEDQSSYKDRKAAGIKGMTGLAFMVMPLLIVGVIYALVGPGVFSLYLPDFGGDTEKLQQLNSLVN